MKYILSILFFSLLLNSCNFEFIREEDAREKNPVPYFLRTNLEFVSRSISDFDIYYLSTISYLASVNSQFVTDDVPSEAHNYDSSMFYYYSLLVQTGEPIWSFGFKQNDDQKFRILEDSVFFPINKILNSFTYSDLKLKFKFINKFYSDSIYIPIPNPVRIYGYKTTIEDSTYNKYSTRYEYTVKYVISVNKESFKWLMASNWKMTSENYYYYSNAERIVNGNFLTSNTFEDEGDTTKVTYKMYSPEKINKFYGFTFKYKSDDHFSEITYVCRYH